MTLPTQTAIDELDALVRRYPNHPDLLFFYSAMMRRIGRLDSEISLLNKSVALDPLSAAGRTPLGSVGYVGASLLIDSINGDAGCEVMALPGILLKKRTHLACLVFSPLDWLESKLLG